MERGRPCPEEGAGQRADGCAKTRDNRTERRAEDYTASLPCRRLEVKKVAGEITFADMAEELDVFAQATSDAETALSRMQSSLGSLKKENWKVGLGMELSETDKDGYKSAIENFLSTSQFSSSAASSSVITLSSRAIFIESVSWVPKSSI